MQYRAYFGELVVRVFLPNLFLRPKNCLTAHGFIYIWYYKWWQHSFRCLLLLHYPQLTQCLNFFDEGILCIFGTGKAQPWCVVHPFTWKETGLVFHSSPKVPSKSDSYLMRSCSNFVDDWHWDACNCPWQSTGDLLFCLCCVYRPSCTFSVCMRICDLAT